MISHLQMITIYVGDLTRAVNFYTRKLGFKQVAEFDDGSDHLVWVVPHVPDGTDYVTQIALYAPADKSDPRIGNVGGMVFSSDDVEAAYHQLKERGVHFTLDLIRHPYGAGQGDQEARFVDPDGNEFLLHT